MSAYRNEFLITQVLDPVFSNNQRCVFKIPHMIVVKKSVALGELSYGPANRPYTMIGGVQNLIKNISLRVGGTQVDYNAKCAVTNVLSGLRVNASRANNVDHCTKKTSLDFKTSLMTNEQDNRMLIVASNFGNQTNTASGTVYLYDVLRFFLAQHNLNGVSNEFLPFNLFKNQDIELMIEWESNPQILTNQSGTITSVNPPVLIMDCIEKSSPFYEVMANLSEPVLLKYDRWEQESILYSTAGNDENTQVDTRERLNQANGKMVKRVCVLNQANEYVSDLGIISKSAALPNEKWQMICNGRQVFDFRVEGSSEKVSQFVNVWGDYIAPPGSRYYASPGAEYVTNKTSNVALGGQESPIVGNASLFGFKLNKRVDYLELDHSHTGDSSKAVTAGVMNVVYETENMLIVAGDGSFKLGF
jgi:hypothetical protein